MEETATDVREQMGQLLQGRSDAEILEFVSQMDTDDMVVQIFDAMAERFNPARAGRINAVAQWEIVMPSGAVETIQVKVADDKCSWTKGVVEPARVTINLGVPDFLRLLVGQLDGMQAFMTGKIRLGGDLMFAQTMQTWFE